MFPYRQRTPVYGGKLKVRKKQEAQRRDGIEKQGEPLANGGPVQCAIRLDLLEQRPGFMNQVSPVQCEELRESQHSARGNVFVSFKEVFRRSKIALLHTRVAPPRCDRESYSQLIYAACLSLLRDAFRTEGCFRLENAAYALFCLYTLYETNPLPAGPRDERSMLEMLPLGLHSAENSKYLYRRSFKTPIRIDRAHYVLLQRLRDEAMARQAECQLARLQAWEKQIHVTLHGEQMAVDGYSCVCGVATDTLHILDRLFAANSFDMAEYTGPCGLEGLAGHEDYPYGAFRPKKKLKRKPQHSCEETTRMTDLELDGVGRTKATFTPCELSTSMESYWSHLQFIRSPRATHTMTQKKTQIRNSLEPLREQNSSYSIWKRAHQALLLNPPQGSAAVSAPSEGAASSTEPRLVGTSNNIAERQGGNIERTDDESAAIETSRDRAFAEQDSGTTPRLPYRFVIPHDLPKASQDGMRKALEVMMEREGDSVLARFADSHLNEPFAVGAPVLGGEESSVYHGGDDLSSIGYEGASVRSIATGRGESALRALLLSASTAVENEVPAAPKLPRPPRAKPATKDRNYFLTLDSSNSEAEKWDEGSASSVSELSSDDEVSIAASAIGQTALRTLLATVHDSSSSKHTTKRKARKTKKTANNNGVGTLKRGDPNKVSPSHKRPRQPEDHDVNRTSASKHQSSDEEFFLESGSAALDSLLSRVTRDTVPDDGTSD